MTTCVVAGAWGDCIASLGNAYHLVPEGPLDLVYFGRDPHVASFLSVQKRVARVRHLRPLSDAEYQFIYRAMWTNRGNIWQTSTWLPSLARRIESDPEAWQRWIPAWVCQRDLDPVTPHRWTRGCVSGEAMLWADIHIPARPFTLYNPYSTQSVSLSRHWPNTYQVLTELLRRGRVVMVGQEELMTRVDHPRLLNLTRCAPNNACLFALALRAARIVTTCNSLALWCVVGDVSASVTVLANAVLDPGTYFHAWIDKSPCSIVPYESTLDDLWTIYDQS